MTNNFEEKLRKFLEDNGKVESHYFLLMESPAGGGMMDLRWFNDSCCCIKITPLPFPGSNFTNYSVIIPPSRMDDNSYIKEQRKVFESWTQRQIVKLNYDGTMEMIE